MANMKRGRYTFDVQQEDGGFRRILIRLANNKDRDCDTFETVRDAVKKCGSALKMDIFISLEVAADGLGIM